MNIINNTSIFNGDIKNTLMYYQTTLRNVGLYTTISVSLFTFSKFFADTLNYSSKNVRILIRFLSIVILGVACYICYTLYNDVTRLKDFIYSKNSNKIIDINNWHNLLLVVFSVLVVLLIICLYVFYVDIYNHKFSSSKLKKSTLQSIAQ